MTSNEYLEELQTQLMFADDTQEWERIYDQIEEVIHQMEVEVYHLSQIEK